MDWNPSKYEMGQSAPTLEILLRLSVHSGRSVDWIIKGGDERTHTAPQ